MTRRRPLALLPLLLAAAGAFLVDDQHAPLTERIRAAVAAVSPGRSASC